MDASPVSAQTGRWPGNEAHTHSWRHVSAV